MAHGEESFIEKGQMYSTSDLRRYFLETCTIFEDLQKEFAKYVKDKKYLKWVSKIELHWKYLVQD